MKRLIVAVAVIGLVLLACAAIAWRERSRGLVEHFQIDPQSQRIVRIDSSYVTSRLQRFLGPKLILLSIDDAPANADVDRRILKILKKHQVRAIWFITCKTLDSKEDPAAESHRQVLKEILADGHVLGNHGYHHLNLRSLDAAGSPLLAPEIVECSRLIQAEAGVWPKYFRPPFGASAPRVDQLIRSQGMQSVLWSKNTFDSLLATFKTHPRMYVDYVHNNPAFDVAGHAEDGDIVLMHDYPDSVETLDEMLTKLQSRGFVFVVPD